MKWFGNLHTYIANMCCVTTCVMELQNVSSCRPNCPLVSKAVVPVVEFLTCLFSSRLKVVLYVQISHTIGRYNFIFLHSVFLCIQCICCHQICLPQVLIANVHFRCLSFISLCWSRRYWCWQCVSSPCNGHLNEKVYPFWKGHFLIR